MSDFYDRYAHEYADKNETEPFNALYERPAALALLGDVAGQCVLDAGCGPGRTPGRSRSGAPW